MILLIYINIGQQQQSGIKLITCTKSQMIYITLTCLKLDIGDAFLLHDDIDNR